MITFYPENPSNLAMDNIQKVSITYSYIISKILNLISMIISRLLR